MKADPLPTAPIEQIRQYLVALRMPRALEMLDHLVQRIERGQLGTIEAIEALLAEELTIREGRRIKAAFITIRVIHVENCDRPSNRGRFRYAASMASCKASSASSALPSSLRAV